MHWSKALAGDIKAATDRFWHGLGDDADTVADLMTNDPIFLGGLVAHARANVKPVEVAPPAKLPVLRLVDDNIKLDAVAAYDPASFETRAGLWVYDDEAMRRLVSKAKPVANLAPVSLSSYDLVRNAYDKEITPELSAATYVWDESGLCARIEQMIAKQPNGEEGDLLNNGYANLFYAAGCVVRVYWRADFREWRVDAWRRGGSRWGAGHRAFSRN